MRPLREQTSINLSKGDAKKLIESLKGDNRGLSYDEAWMLVDIVLDYQRLAEQTRGKDLKKVI